MAPALAPYDDVDAGDRRRARRRGCGRSTDRGGSASAVRPAMSTAADVAGDVGRRLGRGRRSEQLGAAGRRQPRPRRRRSTSTCGCRSPGRRRTFRPTTRPASTAGSSRCRRAWRRRRTLLRVGAANSMGFVWVNGQFVGFGTDSHLRVDVRHHRARAARHEHRVHRRAALERVDVGRGPGPVVDARAAPQRRVGVGADGRPRRHGDRARARSRRHDGHARPRRRASTSADGSEPGPLTVEVVVTDPAAAGVARPLATTGRLDVPRWAPRDEGDEHAIAYTWPGHRVLDRLRVPGIESWNHETPRRYRVAIVLRDGDGAVARRAGSVGRVPARRAGRPGPARQRRRRS